jgi:tetratricopeptide (TPR) repeat protein
MMGSPLTQPLTNRSSEALCWANLAFAQVHAGQVQNSIRSCRRALALSQEIKNVSVQVISTNNLTHGLLEAGAYEEALVLTQQTVELARTLPLAINFQVFLTALGSTYQAVQRWEEAHRTLEEAEAVAETLDLGPLRVPALSRLCMHYAMIEEWDQAYRYAIKAITVRKSSDVALLVLDFYHEYETEALLHGGDERQAREEVHRLGERLGPYRRFRIPYLRSEALLSAWDGQREQAIGHLTEAAQLAAELGLPAERWQIQATLGRLYQVVGEPTQAQAAFGEAATIIRGLAEDIGDEALRTNFLAGPQIQPVLQQAQREASQAPKDHR